MITTPLDVYIDGNIQPMPSYGYYVKVTDHLRCFVAETVMKTDYLEWMALKVFLQDDRYLDFVNIEIFTDSMAIYNLINGVIIGLSPEPKHKETFSIYKEVMQYVNHRKIHCTKVRGSSNLVDSLMRKAIKNHYNHIRWEYDSVGHHSNIF